MKKFVYCISILCFWGSKCNLYAQDDLLNSLNTEAPASNYVLATWKATQLGNLTTTKLVGKKHLEYKIQHRFGNIADRNRTFNQMAHSLWGLDSPSDIRFSLDYGITDEISVGFGRSKISELIDANIKWNFFKQTTDFKKPFSMVLFLSAGYAPVTSQRLYSEVPRKNFKTREAHRFNYLSQLLVASKINKWLSLELAPTLFHANFTVQKFNSNNSAVNKNTYFALGAGARTKITDRMTFFADYFFIFNSYFYNNPNFTFPLSTGFEIETGGHVFTLFFANNAAISQNNFLTQTTDKWSDFRTKFGFSISRTFSLERKGASQKE